MEYRKLSGGERVSTIGIGGGYLRESSPKEIERILSTAMDRGITLLDLVMNDDAAMDPIARALRGKREKMLTQMHFGVSYPKGIYARTRNPQKVQQAFEEQLHRYGTDYTDIGLIHCIDDETELEQVLHGGTMEYALKMKRAGAVRYVGFASHTPAICQKLIDTGLVDIFMLSINAAYDLKPRCGSLALDAQRMNLYRECQRRGIAITVMKPYGGGQLLDQRTSPFGQAMTIPQCLQYALDRPGVLSCLCGVRSVADLKETLRYYDSTPEQRDYSFLGSLPNKGLEGICIYCNHCQPCPAGIDIGNVNRFYDLANAGDELAREHYAALSAHVSDCIDCGACENNCPFHVSVRERLQKAQELFGK